MAQLRVVCRNLSRIAACVGIVVGASTLVGWIGDLTFLKSVFSGGAPMKPNTALCFMLTSIALLLSCGDSNWSEQRTNLMCRIARAAALIAALIGALTLVEEATGISFGIDNLLFPDALATTYKARGGRMTIAAALGFLSLGSALLLVDVELFRKHRPSQYLAIITTSIGAIALLGYIYGVHALYQFYAYSSMALHTASCFVMLGVGVLACRPESGIVSIITSERVGGLMARRMLPAAVFLPLIIGWLRLKGEQAGLYDTAFGLALFAASNIIVFTILVWVSAQSLNRIDRDRSNAEVALRNSERQFRALIEHGADVIALVNARLEVTYVSPAILEVEGYRAEELLGRPAMQNDHPEDLEITSGLFRSAMERPGEPARAQWRRRHKRGIWLWLDGVATSLLDDPAVGAIVTNYRDITNLKIGAEALRESEQRFSKAFLSSPAAMAFVRLRDHCFVSVNESWLRITGFTRDDVVGRTPVEIGLMTPEEIADMVARLEGAGAIQDNDAALRTRAGEVRSGVLSAQIVMLQSEPIVMTVFMDLTERNLAEEARQRLEVQLRQSQKMEAMGTLASGIAHDFNNILTAIVGNATMMREDLPPDHPMQEDVSEIYRAGVRATDLVRRILAFSRQQEPKLECISVAHVAEEVCELLRATLPSAIRIQCSMPSELPFVMGDPTQIHQVLLNLGTNAAHAIADKPGEIVLTGESVFVSADEVETLRLPEGQYVRITCRDNGSGMEREVVQRIFDPFFTTKPLGKGTGLGLSVVHGIMQNHNGTVVVYSEVGKGTAFHLYFPAMLADSPQAERQHVQPPSGSGERILYVDDEDAIISLVQRILGRLNYVVDGYNDPLEALEVFRSDPQAYDAVITDLSMPGMSGFEFAREVRELNPGTPVLLTSGYISQDDIGTAKSIGIRELVLKPNSMEDLGHALHQSLHDQLRSNGQDE